jgi:alkanesulfonate monooxygenase SsuD/methylene tetrahydromethanopterin reductase-like flavin-dependent oxidoreductase (luciferase family)
MPGIASSATAVLVGYIAAATSRIRVGSGGIMLPNHAPLVVAEAFGTLAELYPERIDLGLGRAPGTDQITMRALRRDRPETEADFPREISELQQLLGPRQPGSASSPCREWVRKYPSGCSGPAFSPPAWRQNAGYPTPSPRTLRPPCCCRPSRFTAAISVPPPSWQKPYVIIGVPLIAAATDDEAEYLASSTYQRILGILTGDRRCLPPPVANYMNSLQPHERSAINDFLAAGVIGGPERVREGLIALIEATAADELMFVCDIFDPALRLCSLDIAAAAFSK